MNSLRTFFFLLSIAFTLGLLVQDTHAQTDLVACRAGWDSRFGANPVYAQGGFQGSYYDTDGKLWLRGNPITAGSRNVNWEARWDGAEWNAFPVAGFTLGPIGDRGFLNGETYIATTVPNNFQTGQPMAPFAKWTGTGYARVGSGTNPGGQVQSITTFGGKFYLGGNFTSIDGVTAAHFATFDGTSFAAVPGIDVTQNFSLNARPIVRDGKIYMVGVFRLTGETMFSGGVVEFDGTSWTRVGPTIPSITFSSEWLLQFDEAGVPHVVVATNNGLNSESVQLFKLQGGAWQSVGSAVTVSGRLYWAIGFTGALRDMAFGPGGELYVVGTFRRLSGSTTVGGIIKFDGNAWGPGAGTGAEGVVNVVEYNEGKLYVAGQFETLDGRQFGAVGYTTDGVNWVRAVSATTLGLGDRSSAVAKMGNDIYVGGNFETAGDKIVNGIARWDGTRWHALGSGIGKLATGSIYPEATEPSINKIIPVGTKLYVAGRFETAGGIHTGPVAVWDTETETWSSVIPSDAFGAADISAFNVSGSKLYFGIGAYSSGGSTITTGGFLTYDMDTSTFTAGPTLGGFGVNSIYVDGTDVYVGGEFSTQSGAPVDRIAKLGNGSWIALGSGANGSVGEIFKFGSDLFIAGTFTSVGGTSMTGLAKWNGTTWSAVGAGMSGSGAATTRFFSSNGRLYIVSPVAFAGQSTPGRNGLGYWDSVANTIVAIGPTGNFYGVVADEGAAYFAAFGGSQVGCGIPSSGFAIRYFESFTNGGSDGNWNNGANWASGSAPGPNSVVTVPGNQTVNVTSTDATAKQVLVEANGTINIETGRTLTVESITINGAITGGGTLEVLNCDETALFRSATATGFVRTAVIRCVNDQGRYLFPVGTASGYAPLTVSDVTEDGNYRMRVKAQDGELTADGLPDTKMPLSWEVTTDCPDSLIQGCTGVATATLEFGYRNSDVTATESTYAIFSIDPMNSATLLSTNVNQEANRLTVTGVSSFNLFTSGSSAITSVTVENSNDSGAGSLRDAIATVESGGTVVIPASLSSPIQLTSGQIVIDKDVTITGPGARNLEIVAAPNSRVFRIDIGSTVEISGVTITGGNLVCEGAGGIYNQGNLTLSEVAVKDNIAAGIGGGIYSNGVLNLYSSTVSGNSAAAEGGGIYVRGQFTIINSTIAGNTGSVGGGIAVDEFDTLGSISNSTISQNVAFNGGGISRENQPPPVAPQGCLVGERQQSLLAAPTGGGPSGVTVSSTIIAGNLAKINLDVVGTFDSSGYNLIGNIGDASGFADGVGFDQVGEGMVELDAKLVPLGNNGGQTDTVALLGSSPAVDKGTSGKLATDQRGGIFTRTFDLQGIANASDGTDIGAFEFRNNTINVENDSDSGAGSLRQAIEDAEPGDDIVIPGTVGNIELTNGPLIIDKDINIIGPGAQNLTITKTGGDPFIDSVFIIGGVNAYVSGLTVTGGTGSLVSKSGDKGGGGFLNASGNLTIVGVQVQGNSADFGGGVYNSFGSQFFAIRSTVSGNNARLGGGVYSDGYLEVINSTLSGNLALEQGGGIWLQISATALISNATIAENTAGTSGGGFFYEGFGDGARGGSEGGQGGQAPIVRSSVIAKNSLITADFAPTAVEFPDIDGFFDSQGYNFIGIGDGGNFVDGTNNDIVGSLAEPQDPGLDALGNYGGGTQTLRLQSNSPLLDKGNAFGLDTDQRGAARTFAPGGFTPDATFDGTDIGAFEFFSTTAAGVKLGGRVTDGSGIGMARVRVTVNDTDSGATTIVITNQFGRFDVDGLQAGRTYVVTVRSRNGVSEQTQIVSLPDSLSEMLFVLSR
jgi:hypothetical protein